MSNILLIIQPINLEFDPQQGEARHKRKRQRCRSHMLRCASASVSASAPSALTLLLRRGHWARHGARFVHHGVGNDPADPEKRQKVSKDTRQHLGSLEKKLAALEKQLEAAKLAADTRERAEFLVANLHLLKDKQLGLRRHSKKEVEVSGYNAVGEKVSHKVVIDLAKFRSVDEQISDMFRKAKKVERAPSIIQGLVDETVVQRSLVEGFLREIDDEQVEDEWIEKRVVELQIKTTVGTLANGSESGKKPGSGAKGNLPYRKYPGDRGAVIYVGKSRASNDTLSMKIANPEDIWMHARDCSGSHIVVRIPSGKPEDIAKSTMQKAANLAARHSKLGKTQRVVDVTVTQAKHLRKPKGAPAGAVRVLQELPTMVGYPEDAPPDED